MAEKEARAAELRRRAEESQSGQSDLLEKTNALSQQVSEKKAAQAALAAERDAGERSIADLKRLRLDMVTDRDQRQALMEQFSAANRQAESDIAAHQAQLDSLRQQGTQLPGKALGAVGPEAAIGGPAGRQKPREPRVQRRGDRHHAGAVPHGAELQSNAWRKRPCWTSCGSAMN